MFEYIKFKKLQRVLLFIPYINGLIIFIWMYNVFRIRNMIKILKQTLFSFFTLSSCLVTMAILSRTFTWIGNNLYSGILFDLVSIYIWFFMLGLIFLISQEILEKIIIKSINVNCAKTENNTTKNPIISRKAKLIIAFIPGLQLSLVIIFLFNCSKYKSEPESIVKAFLKMPLIFFIFMIPRVIVNISLHHLENYYIISTLTTYITLYTSLVLIGISFVKEEDKLLK